MSAAFGAFAGALVALVFAIFGFRGPALFAGLGLLPFIGWIAGGFALLGLLFGSWIGELLGSLLAAVFEPEASSGQGATLAPSWLMVVGVLALVGFLIWWGTT